MPEPKSTFRLLLHHFFRRFLDNDTIRVEGDTLTTIVRAIAIVAVPGLMVAFMLQSAYPRRPLWGSIQDDYFFVLYSFVVMGIIAVFEWEMLFPDRLDFLMLSPLPVKPRDMLLAKSAALGVFLGLFLIAANLFGILMLPASTAINPPRQMMAQAISVLLAGAFAALLLLASGGLLLCLLPASVFRRISPLLQMLAVSVLVLLMMHDVLLGSQMKLLLTHSLGVARWMPPVWFLGVYERLFRGSAAPVFAREMSHYAYIATGLAAAIAAVTYPLAWTKMRRLAMEGGVLRGRAPSRAAGSLIQALVRRPGERAVFQFIGQTIARNNRYQVYLAMYCGTGLALAIVCALTFRVQGDAIQSGLSPDGLHTLVPLLLFWVTAGLRAAFTFPVNLNAGWIFAVSGARREAFSAAAIRWVTCCAQIALSAVLAILWVAGWNPRTLLVQFVLGQCLCFLLTDAFFLSQHDVPFNYPRLPGKANLALTLTVYVWLFPTLVFTMVYVAKKLERDPMGMVAFTSFTAAAHVVFYWLRQRSLAAGPDVEGYEGEFQLLRLSGS